MPILGRIYTLHELEKNMHCTLPVTLALPRTNVEHFDFLHSRFVIK